MYQSLPDVPMNKVTALTRLTAGALMGFALAGTAHAEGPSLRPLLGVGVTVGGDELAGDITFDDGYSEDIQAGQFVHLYAGARYQGVPQFSIQATIGYHFDNSRAASNGSAQFERFPLEVLAHFHLDDQLRVGGGVRFVSGARFESSGILSVGDRDFENTTGAVIEAEYMIAPEVGFKLRYVSEKYEAKAPFNDSFDGSHVGFMLSWYL
jgi:Outer membrane protein beta-barrel domain